MPRTTLWLTSAISLAATAAAAQDAGGLPSQGVVPDAKTAEAIAEAVLVPVFGEKAVKGERPFQAALRSDVWTVSGTAHCLPSWVPMTACKGDPTVVIIEKQDGRILGITRER